MGKRKILFCLTGFVVLTQLAYAQPGAFQGGTPTNSYTSSLIPNTKGSSPTVSSFKRLDEISVDMFNGLSMVNIPLLTLQGENVKHNIGLSYYGAGIKVNEMAGWAGLSWNLIGEYQISRSVNDLPDEWFNSGHGSWVNGDYRDKGYFFSANQQLNHNNWTTPYFLSDYSFDPALLNNSNPSAVNGQFIFDGEPDEFSFTLPNGVSGSFYRSHEAGPNDLNGWRVKSKSNIPIEIEHEIYNYVLDHLSVQAPAFKLDNFTPPHLLGGANGICHPKDLLKKFTLKTPDGYKFIFGGVDSAMEVTRGMLLPSPADYLMTGGSHIYHQYTVNCWKLTEIIAPDGEKIQFTYNRGKVLFHRSKDLVGGFVQIMPSGSNFQQSPPKLEVSANVTYPVYLSSIETTKQRLEFKRSQAVEKWYTNLIALGGNQSSMGQSNTNHEFSNLVVRSDAFCAYAVSYLTSSSNPNGQLPNYNQQLDSIILIDKIAGKKVSGYKLVHSADPSKRRTLNGIYKFNFQDNRISNNHSFEYDGVDILPDLEAWNRDFWGFETSGDPNPVAGLASDYVLPTQSGQFSTKGLLKKVTNPYGGYTEFEYEARGFGKQIQVQLANNTVGLINTTYGVGPGARVKKIKQTDFLGAPAIIKEYKYVNNYPNSNTSSGIMNFDHLPSDDIAGDCNSMPGARLLNLGTLLHMQFVKQFKGGIVNYSEVTEVNADGSYSIYKYSNADDPAYRDEIHSGYGNNNVSTGSNKNFRVSSMDLERGNIINVKMFNATHDLVKEVTNAYQNDPARKNQFCKAVSNLTLGSMDTWACSGQGGTGLPNHRAWAYKIYTYKNPLIKTTETDYSDDGTLLTKETDYAYDQYGNTTLATTLSSDGRTVRKATKYNSHADYNMHAPNQNNTAGIGIRNLMLNFGIKNYPVEVTLSEQAQPVGGAFSQPLYTSGELYLYKVDKPVLLSKSALGLTSGLQEGLPGLPGGYFSSKIDAAGNFIRESSYQWQESVSEYTNTPALTSPKPRTIESRQNGKASLTWDNQGHFLSSKTANAAANEIAFSGFEGNYTGDNSYFKNGWQFDETKVQTNALNAFTGEKVLSVDATTDNSFTGAFIKTTGQHFGGKKYKVSFWAKLDAGAILYYTVGTNNSLALTALKEGVNNWKYYELETPVNSGQDIGIILYKTSPFLATGLIDELMFYPMKTQMESYSYNTGTGNITSMNSGNGHIIKYEYDNLGRLITERDEKGNIIKKYNYKTHFEPDYATE